MLKLWSTAIATCRGNAPAANAPIFCGVPSSSTSKSSAVNSRTGRPAASVTLTYTSTPVVDEVNWARAGATAHRAHASKSRVILFLLLPPHLEGAAMFGRIGIPELLIILVIILVLFGASRLPEIGRGIGKGIRNFKDANKDDKD